MYSQALLVLAAAALSNAVTPAGFEPKSETQLLVTFGNLEAINGANVPKNSVQVQPTLSTATKLTGEFAVIMVDLDIPTNSPPKTSTLLHWMQTGLTSADTATMLNVTATKGQKGEEDAGAGGMTKAFILQNKANMAPLAAYIGPNPPARAPLSHRYTQILVDHTGLSASALSMLQMAAATRQGFDAMQVLMQAGLMDKVVAGNFFNVTNGSGGGFSNGTSTGQGEGQGGKGEGGGKKGGQGTGTAGAPRPTTTTFKGAAAVLAPSTGLVSLFVGLAAFAYLGL